MSGHIIDPRADRQMERHLRMHPNNAEVSRMIFEAIGPFAIVVEELMTKVARLEDTLGITDESIQSETERPRGTPFQCHTPPAVVPDLDVIREAQAEGGDVEC